MNNKLWAPIGTRDIAFRVQRSWLGIRKSSLELGVEPRTSHILKLCFTAEWPHLPRSQALLHCRPQSTL